MSVLLLSNFFSRLSGALARQSKRPAMRRKRAVAEIRCLRPTTRIARLHRPKIAVRIFLRLSRRKLANQSSIAVGKPIEILLGGNEK